MNQFSPTIAKRWAAYIARTTKFLPLWSAFLSVAIGIFWIVISSTKENSKFEIAIGILFLCVGIIQFERRGFLELLSSTSISDIEDTSKYNSLLSIVIIILLAAGLVAIPFFIFK